MTALESRKLGRCADLNESSQFNRYQSPFLKNIPVIEKNQEIESLNNPHFSSIKDIKEVNCAQSLS
jgi:hypothetical protein